MQPQGPPTSGFACVKRLLCRSSTKVIISTTPTYTESHYLSFVRILGGEGRAEDVFRSECPILFEPWRAATNTGVPLRTSVSSGPSPQNEEDANLEQLVITQLH